MSEEAAERTLAHWLAEPERVCPVLAGPAMLRGRTLRIRVGGHEHTVTAPARFLDRVYAWCDGEHTRAQIGRLAQRHRVGPRFGAFVDALMAAGIVVDGAQLLAHAAQHAAYPSWTGLAAPAAAWPLAAASVAERLPAAAAALPPADTPRLSALVAKRRSAHAFAREAASMGQLAGLLAAMYGVLGDADGSSRTVASAGGLYRLQVALVLMKAVGDRAEGLYRVHYARSGAVGIERIADMPADVVRAFVQPQRLLEATGIVIVATDLRAGSLKYRNRIYPYALLEAGAVLQNAALACVEAGIGWRTLGGFDDARVARLCEFEHATPLAAGVFGESAAATAPPSRQVELAWSNAFPACPFHLASARLTDGDHAPGTPCWGRDRDPVRALDKALAEATERASYRQRRDDVEACAGELAGDWLHPDRLARWAPAQRRRRHFPFAPFVEAQPRHWVRSTRLEDAHPVWVAANFVFAPSAFDAREREGLLFHAGSSGCASHRSVDEAVQAAVLELVERDAFARHWLAQRPGVQVAPDDLPAWIGAHIAALAEQGCTTWVQRLQPLGLPAWMVLVRCARLGFNCAGAAAGLDAEAALESAWTEAATGALTRLGGVAARPITAADVRRPRDHADLHALRRHLDRTDPLLPAGPPVRWREAVAAWPASFGAVLDALRRAGTGSPHIVDLGSPDAPRTWSGVPIRTVRALVPGLVPLVFGPAGLPAAMVHFAAPGSRFPHPFP